MPNFCSPLRYPGGKASLTPMLSRLLALNNLRDCVYAEPYAGGAGAALSLLLSERVSRIIINDADRCVYSFWRAVLTQPKRLLQLLDDTPVTVDEWHRQRRIYLHPSRHSGVRLGFATFFLNRCNRSGILPTGGPIGGHEQTGKYKIDARFNKPELRRRLQKIIAYGERIAIFNYDALGLLRGLLAKRARREPVFAYLDPPYYAKGRELYLSAYEHKDHVKLARFLKRRLPFKWICTYDNVPQIHSIYADFERIAFDLPYIAYKRRTGQELLIHNGNVVVPNNFQPLLSA